MVKILKPCKIIIFPFMHKNSLQMLKVIFIFFINISSQTRLHQTSHSIFLYGNKNTIINITIIDESV